MGEFKPLLPFGDQTVVECCLTNLRRAGIEEIVVVVGHRANDISAQLKDYHLTFAINSAAESPMSISIARGVEQVSADAGALLIALVDHPAVDPGTIQSITQEWRTGAKLVQPEHDGRGGHPVLIDISYRDELLNLDAGSGLRSFFAAHRKETRRLPVASPYVARDMDTWEDYARLHQDVFRRPPGREKPTGT